MAARTGSILCPAQRGAAGPERSLGGLQEMDAGKGRARGGCLSLICSVPLPQSCLAVLHSGCRVRSCGEAIGRTRLSPVCSDPRVLPFCDGRCTAAFPSVTFVFIIWSWSQPQSALPALLQLDTAPWVGVSLSFSPASLIAFIQAQVLVIKVIGYAVRRTRVAGGLSWRQ